MNGVDMAGANDEHGLPEARLLKIGEMARRCGVSIRTLRYYQELGLVKPHSTTAGQMRLYDLTSVDRIKKITRLKDIMNLSLEEIQQVIDLDDRLDAMRDLSYRTTAMGERIEVAENYLELLRAQREVVLVRRRQLDEYIEELEVRMARATANLADFRQHR
jgi:DNA-binding transcriptional MerR regulator